MHNWKWHFTCFVAVQHTNSYFPAFRAVQIKCKNGEKWVHISTSYHPSTCFHFIVTGWLLFFFFDSKPLFPVHRTNSFPLVCTSSSVTSAKCWELHSCIPCAVLASVKQDADVERNGTSRVCWINENEKKNRTTVAEQQLKVTWEKTNNQLLNRFATENGTARTMLAHVAEKPSRPSTYSIQLWQRVLLGKRILINVLICQSNCWWDKLVTA